MDCRIMYIKDTLSINDLYDRASGFVAPEALFVHTQLLNKLFNEFSAAGRGEILPNGFQMETSVHRKIEGDMESKPEKKCLFYHPESGCYLWEYPRRLGEGDLLELLDVTGNLKHEAAAKVYAAGEKYDNNLPKM